MKIIVTDDEWCVPMYSTPRTGGDERLFVEVPDEMVKAYDDAYDAFTKAADALEAYAKPLQQAAYQKREAEHAASMKQRAAESYKNLKAPQ